jgi:hypothetical protein
MSSRRAPGIRIEHAMPIAEGLLVVVTREAVAEEPSSRPALSARRGGKAVPLEARWLAGSLTENPDEPGRHYLATAAVPTEVPPESITALRYGSASAQPIGDLLRTPAEVAAALVALDAQRRAEITEFLADAPGGHSRPVSEALAADLAALRDALRAPLPTPAFKPGPFNARLESVTAIDDRCVWLAGWIHAANPRAVTFTAISPEGSRQRLAASSMAFQSRPAIAKTLGDNARVSTLGFNALLELDHASRHTDGWVLECQTDGEDGIEDRAPPVRYAPAEARRAVTALAGHPEVDDTVYAAVVLPALARLRAVTPDREIAWTLDLGDVPIAPRTSIVIAVERLARIEHQLSQFGRDRELDGEELMFVVADDDRALELPALLEELHLLHGVPFRVLGLSGPQPRSRALNLGVTLARGAELVLMSGDLLPDAPGWIAPMRAALTASERIAAVGPKLLREDDSIAHAGGVYERGHGASHWRLVVPLAGFARSLPEAAQARQVQLLSSACMMVTADAFAEAGGFPELYLNQADEAADLCLALAAGGAECWYAPEAELYHLDSAETVATRGERFDAWLLDHRWAERLAHTAASSSARFVTYEDAAAVGTF